MASWPFKKAASSGRIIYGIFTAATALGVAITFIGIDPIKALYWSAVINGIVSVPIMVLMMLMTSQSRIMGKIVVGGWLASSVGWRLPQWLPV